MAPSIRTPGVCRVDERETRPAASLGRRIRFILPALVLVCAGSAPCQRQGPYSVVTGKDWSSYAAKDELRGLFGVEGGLNDCRRVKDKSKCAPHLPVEKFYDLVPDPLFGRVIRYNGGPELNIASPRMPGRVAVHGVNFAPLADVWVRQFVRFSSNYTTIGRRGGQGAASHKMMFLRYQGSPARHDWVLEGPRGMTMETGRSQGKVVAAGNLPWHNTRTMETLYGAKGWPFADAFPMIGSPVGPPGAPVGQGTGEWYELVLHHRASGERAEHTLAWRQYTTHGTVAPGRWSMIARWEQFAAGQQWRPIVRYEMGVNRNRQWDEPMFVFWGPYEVVDGSKYPNPWNLPGQ